MHGVAIVDGTTQAQNKIAILQNGTATNHASTVNVLLQVGPPRMRVTTCCTTLVFVTR